MVTLSYLYLSLHSKGFIASNGGGIILRNDTNPFKARVPHVWNTKEMFCHPQNSTKRSSTEQYWTITDGWWLMMIVMMMDVSPGLLIRNWQTKPIASTSARVHCYTCMLSLHMQPHKCVCMCVCVSTYTQIVYSGWVQGPRAIEHGNAKAPVSCNVFSNYYEHCTSDIAMFERF